jgi:hypothetical protein
MKEKGKKTTKKAKASTSQKKIENLSQAHGKEEKFEPTTLDQVWGDDGWSKYRTLNEDEYLLSLKQLNLTDLQTHATKIGLIPINNRKVLSERLVKEFRLHVSSYKKPSVAEQNLDISEEVRRILSEGR